MVTDKQLAKWHDAMGKIAAAAAAAVELPEGEPTRWQLAELSSLLYHAASLHCILAARKAKEADFDRAVRATHHHSEETSARFAAMVVATLTPKRAMWLYAMRLVNTAVALATACRSYPRDTQLSLLQSLFVYARRMQLSAIETGNWQDEDGTFNSHCTQTANIARRVIAAFTPVDAQLLSLPINNRVKPKGPGKDVDGTTRDNAA